MSPADVDQLVQSFTTKTDTKTAVNDEIQYQKVVLGSKSKLLKSSKLTVDQMVKNLKDYIGDDETGTLQGQEDTGKSVYPLEVHVGDIECSLHSFMAHTRIHFVK